MKLHEVLRKERLRRGMTQAELADKVKVNRTTITGYENQTLPIPCDIGARIKVALQSEEFGVTYCFHCPMDLLTMPWLDRVDHHPITVQQKAKVELREALNTLECLDLTNKLTRTALSPEDLQLMEAVAEQLIDLRPVIYTLLGCWRENYGFNVESMAVRGYEKLFAKDYASRQNYEGVCITVA